ncbi:hypothetical protein [Dokdonia sinensis]|uniref:hypothetical protein n=1 Tax=Dokdonia sinensis TaxID=2479847 RepID=UPI001374EA2F|nr:hypothetical protein [Dokdonia sinensis]
MKTTPKSIFNLIEIFSKAKRTVAQQIFKTNCDTNFHDDYYCDSERPYINS